MQYPPKISINRDKSVCADRSLDTTRTLHPLHVMSIEPKILMKSIYKTIPTRHKVIGKNYTAINRAINSINTYTLACTVTAHNKHDSIHYSLTQDMYQATARRNHPMGGRAFSPPLLQAPWATRLRAPAVSWSYIPLPIFPLCTALDSPCVFYTFPPSLNPSNMIPWHQAPLPCFTIVEEY